MLLSSTGRGHDDSSQPPFQETGDSSRESQWLWPQSTTLLSLATRYTAPQRQPWDVTRGTACIEAHVFRINHAHPFSLHLTAPLDLPMTQESQVLPSHVTPRTFKFQFGLLRWSSSLGEHHGTRSSQGDPNHSRDCNALFLGVPRWMGQYSWGRHHMGELQADTAAELTIEGRVSSVGLQACPAECTASFEWRRNAPSREGTCTSGVGLGGAYFTTCYPTHKATASATSIQPSTFLNRTSTSTPPLTLAVAFRCLKNPSLGRRSASHP